MMTLQEALDIVNSNEQGVKHNYFDEYLPAILLVNETYPVVGYVTINSEEDDRAVEDRLFEDELAKQAEVKKLICY